METREIIIGVVLAIVIIAGGIYVNGFKNWLVWAVSEAEALFGSKTGQLKLRYVYNMAVECFPTIAKFVPFAVFSNLVDSALAVMRDMIKNNKNIADAITDEMYGDTNSVE